MAPKNGLVLRLPRFFLRLFSEGKSAAILKLADSLAPSNCSSIVLALDRRNINYRLSLNEILIIKLIQFERCGLFTK